MKLQLIIAALVLVGLSTEFISAQVLPGSVVSQQQFRRQMKKKNTILLDVRTAGEYKTGYILNAINYDVLDSLAFVNAVSSLDKNKKYLLYCQSGRRSGKALVIMKSMGYRNVRHLKGGVSEWKGELKKPL